MRRLRYEKHPVPISLSGDGPAGVYRQRCPDNLDMTVARALEDLPPPSGAFMILNSIPHSHFRKDIEVVIVALPPAFKKMGWQEG